MLYIREEDSLMIEEPPYWGSWKGRVIVAIAIAEAKTWAKIREATGLSEESLNKALSEMFSDGVLEKRGDEYWVMNELYYEYVKFLETLRSSDESVVREHRKNLTKFSLKSQEDLVRWIEQWRKVKGLSFPLEQKHFF